MTEPASGQARALGGVRVVELGEGIAAPFCARLFADYGADVVKLERPGAGDVTRGWGPFPGDRPDPEHSGLFFFLNTSKRSVALDVSQPAGRSVLAELLAGADVFVHDRRRGELEAWGLDHPSLAPGHPDLISVSITPYGETGPYAQWRGYDLNAYHLTATGSRYCGYPDRAPLQQGTFSADFFGGYVATAWALAALHGRSVVGGQHLDVSTAEVLAALFTGAQNVGPYAQEGRFERRSGAGMSLAAPARIMPCRDGFVWLIALEPGQWDGLCAAMGHPAWSAPEILRDLFERGRNADLVYTMLEQWTLQHTKQEIQDLCQAHGCPTTAVYTIEELVAHPHLAARKQIVTLEHPSLGPLQVFGPPIRLPACPGGPSAPAPMLGQHTRSVVGALPGTTRGRARPPGGDGDDRGLTTGRHLPLAGIRVANFGSSWVGPVAGQTLAFLGAEVYKVESRARIDINRTLPPFAEGIPGPDRSLQNHAGWAGNGSITLDLRHHRGRDLALQLVERSDVVLENFGPGVMDRLGLSYDELRRRRPDVILVSMPAAGLDGPLSSLRTYGTSLSAIAGLDSVTGYTDTGPVTMENAFADPLGGIVGAIGALLALFHRRNTGEGQHVDYSQQEGALQFMGPALMDLVLNGRVAGPIGNRHPVGAGAPHGVFPCAGEDRWVSIAVLSDTEWAGLRAAMGEPGWAADPALATAAGRVAHIDEVHDALAAWTRSFDDHVLAEALQAQGVAAAPVLDVSDLLHDPHLRARGTFIEVRHPLGFLETIYGAYVKTSRTVPAISPGPAMGQDNDHVFLELLGLPLAEYRRLAAEGVIA